MTPPVRYFRRTLEPGITRGVTRRRISLIYVRVAALNASVPVVGFSTLLSNSREQLLHHQGFVINKENYKKKKKYEVVRTETIF